MILAPGARDVAKASLAQPLMQTPFPPPPPSSHLRRQHGDVVELKTESGGEAELLGLPFPGKGGSRTQGEGRALGLKQFHILVVLCIISLAFEKSTESLSLFSHL